MTRRSVGVGLGRCVLGVGVMILAGGLQGWSQAKPVVAERAKTGEATETFQVASVKRAPDADPATGTWSLPDVGRFTAAHVSLGRLIQLAFGVTQDQIVNQPGWLGDDLFDVQARPEDGIALSREELRPRLQRLLAERFHLVTHTEDRMVQGYALVPSKGGAHLSPTTGAQFAGFRTHVGDGEMRGINWSMPQLAKYLADASGFPVIDRTGIPGSYDIGFSYNPRPEAAEGTLRPLEDALREATGLNLKSEKVTTRVLVIDSVDRTPTEN